MSSQSEQSSASYQPDIDKNTRRIDVAGGICLLAALIALIATIVNMYADISADGVKMTTYLFYAAMGVVGCSYIALVVLFTKKNNLVLEQNIASARERKEELDALKDSVARSNTLQGSVENFGTASVNAAEQVFGEAKEVGLSLLNRFKGKKTATGGMTSAQQNVLLGGLSNPFYMA